MSLRSLIRRADSAVIFSAGNSALQAISLVGVTFLISSRLPPELQGLYYTFLSVISMQVFVELGFGQSLIQCVAHEAARVDFLRDGSIAGHPESIQRLGSISKLAIKWYACASILVFLFVGFGGDYFFRTSRSVESSVWFWPWWLLVLSTSISLILQPVMFILEGAGQVAWVNFAKLSSYAVRLSCLMLFLSLGWGLYSLSVAAALQSLLVFIFLVHRWRKVVFNLLSRASNIFSWKEEMMPLQSRLAVSWGAGYFIFSIFNPVIFRVLGASEAGRFGMTWNIMQGVSTFAMVWVSTKIPSYCRHIVLGERRELDRLWLKSLILSLVTCFGALVLYCVVISFGRGRFEIFNRVLSFGPTLLIAFATMVNVGVFAMAAYLRAHKVDPYMWISILSAGLTVLFLFLFVRPLGVNGAALAYLITACISTVPAIFIFLGFRRRYAI